MDQNLRYGEDYGTIHLETHYDFSKEGGLATAIEMCNGMGVCRKTSSGTMCPSYMVTRDEAHSTRGRANLMREILSGKLPAEEWTGDRLRDGLDLCLECKACKAECPSNVDMAKLKYEFLAGYNDANGTPLRSAVFGHIHRISRVASVWPELANWTLENPTLRRVMDRWIGIDERRTLPRFAQQTFEKWFRRRDRAPQTEPVGRLVLFHDTFLNYNHPEIGKAATLLLEAAGYEVRLADRVCCGRPMISKGLAETARSNAAHNVGELHRWVTAGYSIVGCEPSCLLTFRDEYADLVSGPEVEAVAKKSFLLEEFIAQETQAGRWTLPYFRDKPRALVHTHCHEKALVGSRSLTTVLGEAYRVEEIDSGCCGMAGSFGYEKEHYDVSLAVGRRRLLPALTRESGAVVITPGISCRQQIADATGRRALHPAEALVEALDTESVIRTGGPHG